jgi:hypothetical protein
MWAAAGGENLVLDFVRPFDPLELQRIDGWRADSSSTVKADGMTNQRPNDERMSNDE